MFELIPLIGIVVGSATTVLLFWIVARTRQRRIEVQAELQGKLIERFTSAPELVEFLQSPTGRQFVHGVQSVPAVLTRERIVSGVSRAIISTFIGLAFFGMSLLFHQRGLMVPGLIFFFLGIGYLVASYVSHRLAIRLGLAAEPPPRAASTPATTTTTGTPTTET